MKWPSKVTDEPEPGRMSPGLFYFLAERLAHLLGVRYVSAVNDNAQRREPSMIKRPDYDAGAERERLVREMALARTGGMDSRRHHRMHRAIHQLAWKTSQPAGQVKRDLESDADLLIEADLAAEDDGTQ
jgi:hypothetical protein